MRFDHEARTAVREAAPGIATIRWPSGEAAPEKDRVYRMQSLEALESERQRREEHPEKLRDAMAQMHKRIHGRFPEGYKPTPRRRRLCSDRDSFIRVLSVTVLQQGWEVTVELYEDPDPVRHSGVKARVPAGPDPIDGHYLPTEIEPEQIVKAASRTEREDEQESLRVECIASVDRAEIDRLERKLARERRKGKSAKRTEAALARARRRVLASAGEAA